MAKKKPKSSDKTNIRRIKATDDKPKSQATKKLDKATPAKKTKDKLVESTKKASKKVKSSKDFNQPTKNPFKAFGNYLKGSWYELRQVRWPNRAATWGMTLAVLIFTAFFVILIILLDAGFNWVFEQILR